MPGVISLPTWTMSGLAPAATAVVTTSTVYAFNMDASSVIEDAPRQASGMIWLPGSAHTSL